MFAARKKKASFAVWSLLLLSVCLMDLLATTVDAEFATAREDLPSDLQDKIDFEGSRIKVVVPKSSASINLPLWFEDSADLSFSVSRDENCVGKHDEQKWKLSYPTSEGNSSLNLAWRYEGLQLGEDKNARVSTIKKMEANIELSKRTITGNEKTERLDGIAQVNTSSCDGFKRCFSIDSEGGSCDLKLTFGESIRLLKPTSAPPGTPSTSKKEVEGSKVGLIIGCIAGAILVVAVVAGVVIYCCLKRRGKSKRTTGHTDATQVDTQLEDVVAHGKNIAGSKVASGAPGIEVTAISGKDEEWPANPDRDKSKMISKVVAATEKKGIKTADRAPKTADHGMKTAELGKPPGDRVKTAVANVEQSKEAKRATGMKKREYEALANLSNSLKIPPDDKETKQVMDMKGYEPLTNYNAEIPIPPDDKETKQAMDMKNRGYEPLTNFNTDIPIPPSKEHPPSVYENQK